MKTLFLSAAFAALALGANAQTAISFGVEAGANLSSLRINFLGEKTTSSTKAGIRAGAFANIGIGEQLAIQPGIYFSQKGGKNDIDGSSTSTPFAGTTVSSKFTAGVEQRINYIEVPVSVVYHFNNDQSGFFLLAGAYGGAAISGTGKSLESTTTTTTTTTVTGGTATTTSATTVIPAGDEADLEIGSDEAKDDIRRFDLGFQAGAGYQTKMGLLFRAQYMLGAMNISSRNDSDNAIRNGAIALTIGYRFGGR